MVEIKYSNFYEAVDLAGKSIAEARQQFKGEFGIPDRATAKLNGKKVNGRLEAETCLNDSDRLTFRQAGGKMAILVGTVLLALFVTGGVFAYGFTTASNDLTSVIAVAGDFAVVSTNTSSSPDWNTQGNFKGTTGDGTLFDIDTQSSGYSGDFVATVTIANADELVEVYRILAMSIRVDASYGSAVDINGDGSVNSDDVALLTLDNSSVDLFLSANATGDYYTVRLKSGYYASHTWATGWTSGYEKPLLYLEVSQR